VQNFFISHVTSSLTTCNAGRNCRDLLHCWRSLTTCH